MKDKLEEEAAIEDAKTTKQRERTQMETQRAFLMEKSQSFKIKAKRKSSVFHYEQSVEEAETEKKGHCPLWCHQFFLPKNYLKGLVIILIVYNIVFIPLQFAFDIRFDGKYLIMEMLTLLFYSIDIIYMFC